LVLRAAAAPGAAAAVGGIRGIGSVFYLLFALGHGIAPGIAQTLLSLTVWTVAASIIAHGITAQPLMVRYMNRRGRARSTP
jgi:NhaP-type Na+/H+ or K+/H+ antiporter